MVRWQSFKNTHTYFTQISMEIHHNENTCCHFTYSLSMFMFQEVKIIGENQTINEKCKNNSNISTQPETSNLEPQTPKFQAGT